MDFLIVMIFMTSTVTGFKRVTDLLAIKRLKGGIVYQNILSKLKLSVRENKT